MGVDIKLIILVVAYAILSNIILVNVANLNVGLSCPGLQSEPSLAVGNYTDTEDTSSVEFRASVFDIAFNRCSGVPSVLYWTCEVPVLIGLAYIVRSFIGAT